MKILRQAHHKVQAGLEPVFLPPQPPFFALQRVLKFHSRFKTFLFLVARVTQSIKPFGWAGVVACW